MIERKLINAIKNSWDDKTCYPQVKSSWGTQIPELGQCAVTALLINERYGGQILYNAEYDHYWNVLPDGRKIDLTKRQFHNKRVTSGIPVSRRYILHSVAAKKFKTDKRYELLRERVNTLIG